MHKIDLYVTEMMYKYLSNTHRLDTLYINIHIHTQLFCIINKIYMMTLSHPYISPEVPSRCSFLTHSPDNVTRVCILISIMVYSCMGERMCSLPPELLPQVGSVYSCPGRLYSHSRLEGSAYFIAQPSESFLCPLC